MRPGPGPAPRRNTPPEFESVRESLRPESQPNELETALRALKALEDRWQLRENAQEIETTQLRQRIDEANAEIERLRGIQRRSREDDDEVLKRQELLQREVRQYRDEIAATVKAELASQTKAQAEAAGAEGAKDITDKAARAAFWQRVILGVAGLLVTAFHSWLALQTAGHASAPPATPTQQNAYPRANTPSGLPEANPAHPGGRP